MDPDTTLCPICGTSDCDDWGFCFSEADEPDQYLDEAEDKETTDNERDDHEGVPAVDDTPASGDSDAGCGP